MLPDQNISIPQRDLSARCRAAHGLSQGRLCRSEGTVLGEMSLVESLRLAVNVTQSGVCDGEAHQASNVVTGDAQALDFCRVGAG